MKTHSIIIAVVIVLVLVSLCANTALALPGSGTQEDPYRIQSLADFDEFAADPNYWSGFTRLETDVNLAGRIYSTAVIAPDTSSSGGFQGTAFTGVFDGNAHKIINLTIDDGGAGNVYLGLFGCINDGEVKNLGLEGGSISGGSYVGGLVGANGEWPSGGVISNCYSTVSVRGREVVGGLVGINSGAIINCYFTGDVNGIELVGGLVAGNDGTVTNCYSTGRIFGKSYLGGLVGRNMSPPIDIATINNCYSTASVIGPVIAGAGAGWVGGLVGENRYGMIRNCNSTGRVEGFICVGGLVGKNFEATIINCYSTGSILGFGGSGGLVGMNDEESAIVNCYSTGSVSYYKSGPTTTKGLVGINLGSVVASFWDIQTSGQTTSPAGIGKTTAEMKAMSTFTVAGWDFVGETINGPNDIWRMCVDGVEYPLLSWQFVPDFVCPDGVDIFDLAFFVDKWLDECDENNNFCNCTDTNYDEHVNFSDYAILSLHWLEGN